MTVHKIREVYDETYCGLSAMFIHHHNQAHSKNSDAWQDLFYSTLGDGFDCEDCKEAYGLYLLSELP